MQKTNKTKTTKNKNENDLLSIAKSYYKKEKYKEAIKILSELIKLNPNNAACLYYLGCSYYETNQHKKAINHFKKAVKLEPNNVTSMIKELENVEGK